MFRKEVPSKNPNGEGQDVLGAILAEEIQAMLADFSQRQQQAIAIASCESVLARVETELASFDQTLVNKAKPIWGKDVLVVLNRQKQAAAELLHSLLDEKRAQVLADNSRRSELGQAFAESKEVRAALERFSALFPGKELETGVLVIGGKSKDQLKTEIKEMCILSVRAGSRMDGKEFATSQDLEPILLVRLTTADLGFTDRPTIEQMLSRAIKLGLETCPAEVGPHLRLNYDGQELKDRDLWIGMEPITGSKIWNDASDSNVRSVFGLFHNAAGLKFECSFYNHHFELYDEWVFRLRK